MFRKTLLTAGIFILVYFFLEGIANLRKDSYPISICFASGNIDLSGDTSDLNFGGVPLTGNVFSNQTGGYPRCTLSNNGFATVSFRVSASISGGMTLGTGIDDVGPNKCVIAAIFTDFRTEAEGGRDLVKADFGNEDVLSSTPLQATSDNLARNDTNPDPDDGMIVKGYNVAPFSVRSLRFLLQTPTQDSLGGELCITITIDAVM